MTTHHRIMIVGASIAGLTTAESLRLEGFEGEIILMGDEPHLPYSRPPLSKQVLMGEWEPDRTVMKATQELSNLGIQFMASSPALGLDLTNRCVMTSSGVEPFDELVIATGARARSLGSGGFKTLRTLEDATSLRAHLHAAQKVAIVGTGVLGSEIASGSRALGAQVIMIGQMPGMSMGSVGNALSNRVRGLHEQNGVELRLETEVVDSVMDGEGVSIRLSTGEVIRADVAVAAIGAMACTDWLETSGLTLSDGVVCDDTGMAAPGVYAVGDVAAWAHPATGKVRRSENQTNAIEQARSVAGTIVHNVAPPPLIPFFWSEIHNVSIKAYGWFDGAGLTEVQDTAVPGSLLAAEADGRVTGVVSWNAPPREFRTARTLVDEHNNLFSNR
jgi:NADPH-dependent 2,4-dienoyl-CoA reductase/sulfur reductase-like enzyme